ncbi:MAG: hypothetical protein WBF77_05330, partial [Sulfurimonadaceae bacterium]
MKTVIKYVSLSLLFTVVLAISLLFIPPVTKSIVQKALSYFLEVDANVTHASLSIHGLEASGTLDHNDTFELTATPHSFTRATATLHYDGNVKTFSNVATVQLPHIAAVLDATFTTQNLRLDVNASALNGTIKGYLSLEEFNYAYEITDLNISLYQQKQTFRWYTIPGYTTGLLSAQGGGIIESPYTVGFNLQSRDLQLEENGTTLISSELQSPLPLYLEINGSVNTDALFIDISLESALVDLEAKTLHLDLNKSSFDVALALANHDEKIAPIKHVALDLNGTIKESSIDTAFTLLVDDYRLDGEQMRYGFETNTFDLKYLLSSLKRKPLYLQGDYALFGDLEYKAETLSLSADSKAINSPILVTLKDKMLKVISNNINLKSLQETANQDVLVQGNAAINAEADLGSEPLLWKAYVKSENLKLPWEYRKDIGLKNDLQVTLSAHNDEKGTIRLNPTLVSNAATITHSGLLYLPTSQKLFFNINAKKVKTPYYHTSRLNLKGTLDIKASRLNKTRITTPHEKIVINDLRYSKKGVKSHIDFQVDRLDRFADLSRDYNLSGKSFVHYTPKKTEVLVESDQLGDLNVAIKDKTIRLSGSGLGIQELMRLSDQPVILKGDLAYDIHAFPLNLTAHVTSDKLVDNSDKKDFLRPFALDFNTSLQRQDKRYSGQARLKTGDAVISVTDVLLDSSKKQLLAHYSLDVKALEKGLLVLPKEIKGPLKIHGEFEIDQHQRFTLNVEDFQLPKEWHQLLDKNASSYLETNASLQAFNNKGLLNVDANINNRLLQLNLHDSDFDLKSGAFTINSELKTNLWLKDTDISASGEYRTDHLYVSNSDIEAEHETINLHDLHYSFSDQNLSASYKLALKPYPNAPY